MIQNSKRRERIFASFIDFLVFIPFLSLNLFFIHLGLEYQCLSSILGIAIGYLYFVIYLHKYETTFGKRYQGLKIYGIDGSRITYNQCLKRYLGYNLIGIVQAILGCYYALNMSSNGYDELSYLEKLKFIASNENQILTFFGYVAQAWIFINLLFLLFDKNRRTLPDYFAGTIVGKKLEDEINTIGKAELD